MSSNGNNGNNGNSSSSSNNSSSGISSCNQSLLNYLESTPGIIPQIVADETTLVMEQQAIAPKWTINHNLRKIPKVTVVDLAGNILKPHIKHLNTSTIVVTTNPPSAGKVYFN